MNINLLTRCQDVNIINKEVINNNDRNINEIVYNCYGNLKNSILVAYSYEVANIETTYDADFKSYLEKYKKNQKNKYTTFKKNNLKISIDLDGLYNFNMVLKLKYIINPNDISPKYRLLAMQNTINDFQEMTRTFQYVATEQLDELKAKYEREKEELEPQQDMLNFKELSVNLFVADQTILIPILDKTKKYIIDGIKYYGVYNSTDTGRITSLGEYGFKVYRDGMITTTYVGLYPEKNAGFYIRYFGKYYNPFHVLFDFDLNDHTLDELVNIKDKKSKFYRLLKTTFENAKINDNLPEEKNRAAQHEHSFRDNVISGLMTFTNKIHSKNETPTMAFEHLGALEEEIYSSINSISKLNSDKRIMPSQAVKRINLKAGGVLKLIKSGTGENVNKQSFVSTSTIPNPFDTPQMFQYIKTSQHTETGKKRAGGGKNDMNEQDMLIRYHELDYIGQFTSKGSIGKSSTLHFHLPSVNLVKRRTLG